MNKDICKDNILTRQGCKNTKARQAVIDVLENSEAPLSAEDIFLKLKVAGVSTNLSTVYRTLELMESKGLLSKILINDGKALFELLGQVHRHHLICTGCNKIVPIDICPIDKLENDVEQKTKFDITGHRLELFGICPDCKKS